MKQISKFLVSEYPLELGVLAFGAVVMLCVGLTVADLWHSMIAMLACIVAYLIPVVIVALTVTLALSIYFLPTLIARKRKHRNLLAIFVLNLCLTPAFGVGWIVALVWAFLNQTPTTTVIQNAPQNVISL